MREYIPQYLKIYEETPEEVCENYFNPSVVDDTSVDGADKAFDTADFVMELRELGATSHVAQNAYDTGKAKRQSAIDSRA